MVRSNWLVAGVLCVGLVGVVLAQDKSGQAPAMKAKPSAEQKAEKVRLRAEALAKFSKSLGACPTSLADAIAAAEKETGGKAFAAEFETKKKTGALKLGVDILKDGKKIEVSLDPATGKVAKVEDDDSDDDDDSASTDDGDSDESGG